MNYWILKTEPNAYSLSDLEKDKSTTWDGVRNYQARNNLSHMRVGDQALIYHSLGPKEIVGLAKITEEAFFDKTDVSGKWLAVEITFVKAFKKTLTLFEIKAQPRLKNLSLVKQSRLSVCPVKKEEWAILLELLAS
jgi:predicted RNA-binding protein with PUA-like domain